MDFHFALSFFPPSPQRVIINEIPKMQLQNLLIEGVERLWGTGIEILIKHIETSYVSS